MPEYQECFNYTPFSFGVSRYVHNKMDKRELITRVQEGEKEAFKYLVAPYQKKIYYLLYIILGDREDAMDITQEALIKAYQNIKRFRMASSFYTWIYRIAVNLAFDHLRKMRRNPKTEETNNLTGEEGSDCSLMRKELTEQIRRAMAQLSPQHRAIILLRDVEGLSYEEISKVMDCRLGTVMSRLHYARDAMRHKLEPYLKEED